jgi:hypothetical protein
MSNHEPDESPVIANLRKDAEAKTAAEARADAAERRNAFLEAGIDLKSPVGQLLLDSPSVTDLSEEALKAKWAEFQPAAPAPAPEAPAGQSPEEAQVNRDRAVLQSTGVGPVGSQPDVGENPYDAGIKHFREAQQAGRPTEDAAAEWIDRVIAAGARDDDRVIWTKEKHAASVPRGH